MDDDVILDLYWARSESAISETAAKYGHYCSKIAMNILRNVDDADECVNDTYLKTWYAIPPERPAILSSFLAKITRNLSLNKYKEQRAKKRGGSEIALIFDELDECIPSNNNIEYEYELKAAVEIINAFLRAASAESRIVFVRRYFYIDSIHSIAERFGMSDSKVKSILFRMRNKLKTHLEKGGTII